MAEILGAVASGISVAQLASTVVAAGFKIAEYAREISEVPENIQNRLEQLDTLALSLKRLETIENSSQPNPALNSARLQCQACLQDLETILEEFRGRIQGVKGVNRKAAIIRILFKGGILATLEQRLAKSVELLNLTQQIWMLHLVSSQSERIDLAISQTRLMAKDLQSWMIKPVSRPRQELLSLSNFDEHSVNSEDTDNMTNFTTAIDSSTRRYELLRWGSFLDAAVEVESRVLTAGKYCFPSWSSTSSADSEQVTNTSTRLFVTVNRPEWFAGFVPDLSWNFEVRLNNEWKWIWKTSTPKLQEDDALLECLEHHVRERDTDALCRLLDGNADLYLADYRWSGHLVNIALSFRRWSIANLLLDRKAKPFCREDKIWLGYPEKRLHAMQVDEHDIEQLYPWWRPVLDGDNLMQLQRLIQREHHNDLLSATLLRHYEGSGQSFNFFRQSVWSDAEYYNTEFRFERMRVAISLAYGARKTPTNTSAMILQALVVPSCDTELFDLSICDNSGTTILHCLAEAIGFFEGKVETDEWHVLVQRILRQADGLGVEVHLPARSDGPYHETPFIRLLQGCLATGYRSPSSDSEVHPKKRLKTCQTAMVRWLSDLKACGVDLISYGREERFFLLQGQAIVQQDAQYIESLESSEHLFLRLADIHFGAEPQNWRLEWHNLIELLARDFWALVEVELPPGADGVFPILEIPGSWPEYFSDDDEL